MPNQSSQTTVDRPEVDEFTHQRRAALEKRYQELQTERSDLEEKANRYRERCALLERDIRRVVSSDSDMASRYKTYLNTQVRMVGAVLSALKRGTSMDRLIVAYHENERLRLQEEAARKKARQNRDAAKHVQDISVPRDDDFELLYGDSSEVTSGF